MKTKHIRLECFDSIPVFPLNHVHLFPGCLLSLHIFEPRYIDLLKYAMDHDDVLAIADPQSVIDLHQPDLYCKYTPHVPPLVGAGFIVDVKKTRIDTYNVLLQGINRLEILEEHPMDHRFRQFSTRFKEDDPVDSDQLTLSNIQLRQLIVQLGQSHPDFEDVTSSLLQHYVNPDIFTHLIVSQLTESKKLKKQIFLETNPLLRNEIIEEEVGRLIVSSLDDSKLPIIH